MFAASKSGRVAAVVTDPYFPYVPLLLNTTSTNGQQNNTFLDSSTNNFTLTRSGTPTQGSVTPYWPNGYWGNYFNGSTSDYLSTPNSANLVLGSSNYTIECWVFPTVSASSLAMISKGNTSSLGTEFWTLEFSNTTGGFSFYVGAYSSGSPLLTGTATLNAWNHIAVVRNGLVHNLYVNGTSVSNITIGSSYTVASGGNLYLATGWYTPASRAITGYISNARLVIGTAVYTANFTPPTAPVTAITNTSLLVNATNAGIYDAAVQNNEVTVGSAQASTTVAKWSPTSMKFNGTTDYLTIVSNPALNLGTGSFTVEAWVYLSAMTGDYFVISAVGNGGAFFGFNNGTAIGYGRAAVAWDYTVASGVSTGAWYHLAWSRNGTSMRIFVNGNQVGTTQTTSQAYDLTTTRTAVGSQGAVFYLNGYIQDLRITNGIARYTANFSVPTAAFPTR